MEKMHILCGFEEAEFEDALIRELRGCGIEAVIDARFVKASVKEFIENNPSCNTVILTEKIGTKKYTAQELAQLTDKRDVNVIVVLSGRLYGTDYLKTLYTANITSAILQDKRKGVSAKDVAELVILRRSRKAAREYYGIANQRMDVGLMDNDAYVEYHRKLTENGEPVLVNYLAICRKMTPQQIADFTKSLPEDMLEELKRYEEFYVILELLKQFGIDLRIKKPRKVVIGLKTPQRIAINEPWESGDRESKKEKEGVNEAVGTGEEEIVVSEPENISFTSMMADDTSMDDIFAILDGNTSAGQESEVKAESGGEDLGKLFGIDVDAAVAEMERKKALEEEQKKAQLEAERARAEEERIARAQAVHDEEMKALMASNEERLREKDRELEKSREAERKRAEQLKKVQRENEKEINKLRKSLEKEKQKGYDSGADEVYLTSGTQFSAGFVVMMLLIVLVVVGVLFAKPIMAYLGL